MTSRRLAVALLAVLVVGGAVAITLAVTKSDGEDIYLEGAGDTGIDPFTTIAVSRCADGFEAAPAGATGCVPVTSTTTGGLTTTTALYGGSGSQKKCDPEALIAYLQGHPDKAKAWVDGINEDSSVEWSGGNKITVADIPAYIHELTPTFLTEDTRVTNHGYKAGKPTPHQSVLQKGTAVLVDRNGIPRARCACGNPLGRPHKVRDPHYKGHCWDGCRDRPYCSPPGCTGTTTTEPSTTTTTCDDGQNQTAMALGENTQAPPATRGPLEDDPDPSAPTTTEKATTTTHPSTQKTTPSSSSTTAPSTTTTVAATTTTRGIPTTTTTHDPNCPPPGPADCKP